MKSASANCSTVCVSRSFTHFISVKWSRMLLGMIVYPIRIPGYIVLLNVPIKAVVSESKPDNAETVVFPWLSSLS